MSNLSLAYDLATALAGFMFPDTSDNRARHATPTRGELSAEGYKANIERKMKGGHLQRLRASSEFTKAQNERTKSAILAYGKLVYNNTITVGNCFENASVAAWYLNDRLGASEWTLVWHEDFDHVYLVIGTVTDSQVAKPHAEWPKDVAIYDGWGQIACQAIHFSEKWSGKMNEWGATTGNNQPAPNSVFIPGEDGGFVNATVWRRAADTRKAIFNR